MMGWKGTQQYDTDCPDCRVYSAAGVWVRCEPCGLTYEEHRRMSKLRKQAEKQAHQLVVQALERELLPRALIKEVYDRAQQDVRRQLRR
jgi:hypothetical protein